MLSIFRVAFILALSFLASCAPHTENTRTTRLQHLLANVSNEQNGLSISVKSPAAEVSGPNVQLEVIFKNTSASPLTIMKHFSFDAWGPTFFLVTTSPSFPDGREWLAGSIWTTFQ